jgi:hypothetical protein
VPAGKAANRRPPLSLPRRRPKLSAIEVFEARGDPRAGPALIGLLSDADTTVREWAANALSALRYTEAGPALTQLNARLLRYRIRPDFTEPVAVRNAMANLGLRQRRTPDLTRTLAQHISHEHKWPVGRLPEVIRDLADHDQVVLYFMIWRIADDGQLYWTQHEGAGWAGRDSAGTAGAAAPSAAGSIAIG